MNSVAFRAFTELSNVYSGWILWNLFLAFIPLVLSFWLFRRKSTSRSFLWWLVYVVFVAFLPNAPYMLTDVIHLIRGAQSGVSIWVITLLVIPLHVFAMVAGFEAYVVSLLNQNYYLQRLNARRFIPMAEMLAHALCAIGIYMGRFRRFNSWDLVTDPGNVLVQTLDDLTAKRPLVVIAITFVVLMVFYWIMKQITLGLWLRIKFARQGMDVLE